MKLLQIFKNKQPACKDLMPILSVFSEHQFKKIAEDSYDFGGRTMRGYHLTFTDGVYTFRISFGKSLGGGYQCLNLILRRKGEEVARTNINGDTGEAVACILRNLLK